MNRLLTTDRVSGAVIAVLAAVIMLVPIDAHGIPPEEREATVMVRPVFQNVSPSYDTDAEAVGAAFFNGHWGAYAVPDGVQTPAVPTDGSNELSGSAFGQPFSPYVAYENFAEDAVDTARSMLFLQESNGGEGTLVSWGLTITGPERPILPETLSKSSFDSLSTDFFTHSLSISPTLHKVGSAAGSVGFTVSTQGSFDVLWWIESVEGDFFSILPQSGTNSGTFTVDYQENTGGVRLGMIEIRAWAGLIPIDVPGLIDLSFPVDGSPTYVLIVQGEAENILTVDPYTPPAVPPEGGSIEIAVYNQGTGAMDWDAAVSTGGEFLNLVNANGTNDGTFTVNISENTGLPRTGTIFVNSAGAVGSPATVTIYQQGQRIFGPNFGEVPKDIPSQGAVTSTATVDESLVVADVNVHLYIEHTWDEDLDVSLRSPSGTEILLFSGVGGGNDNFGSETEPLILDNDAAASITEGVAPFTGSFRPHGDLSAFAGETALGPWTLTIKDSLDQDPDANPPAFRFIDEIYGNDQGSAVSQLENRLLTEAEIDQMLDEMYGADELERVDAAERLVRNALRYAPFDKQLRTVLLDIFYHRCVASALVSKERLVRAYKKRIDEPQPGERVIDNEIDYFERALEVYRHAADPYYELFTDGMGISVLEFDPAFNDDVPFGYYLFLQEVPGRSLLAATFRDENDNPRPVVAGADGTEPAVLFSGYKDLALLFEIARDHAVVAKELALRYVMRGGPGDVDAARSLINEIVLQTDIEGSVLLGIFPDYDPATMAPNSGVPEAIATWQSAVSELEGLRQFIKGDLNLLGFRDDFLMLVQSFEDEKDSFDALVHWNDAQSLTTPLGSAVAKLGEARDNYDTYRGQQDQLGFHMELQVNTHRLRLASIAGVDPGLDPRNPDHPAYLTPEQNEGSEINLQVTSIKIAMNRIRQNGQEIANLKEKVEIEVQRRAQETGITANIQSIMIDYAGKQAVLTEEIADIEGKQIFAQNMADAANCVTTTVGMSGPIPTGSVSVSGGLVAYTANAFVQQDWEEEKGRLQADKEKLAAMEQCQIKAQDDRLLDVNSRANIKTWLLEMKTLQLRSEEAMLMLNQEVARLTGLLGEKASIEARMAEVSADLLTRYYADPLHRLRYQGAMLDAQKAFEDAQKWVYYTVRAFEYKHNIPRFVTPGGYSLNSVFAARTADELLDIVTAIEAYDVELGLPGGVPKESWLSFVKDLRVANDATGLRAYLHDRTDGGIIVINFSTVLDDGESFFLGPRFLSDGSVATPGSFLDKINFLKINFVGSHTVANTAVLGMLTQGGTQFVRNIDVGDRDPASPNRIKGEMTAWSTRFWFKHPGNPSADPPVPARWRFNDGLQANLLLNLTNTSEDMTTGNEFDEFSERSVAATDWKLFTFVQEGGETRLNIDEVDDIEIYFNHRSKTRPSN